MTPHIRAGAVFCLLASCRAWAAPTPEEMETRIHAMNPDNRNQHIAADRAGADDKALVQSPGEMDVLLPNCVKEHAFETLIPFFKSDDPKIRHGLNRSIFNFFAETEDAASREYCLSNWLAYLLSSGDIREWDVPLLQLDLNLSASEKNRMLEPYIADFVLKQNATPALLELCPQLYDKPEIIAFLQQKAQNVTLKDVSNFVSRKRFQRISRNPEFIALLLLAKTGHPDAWNRYLELTEKGIAEGRDASPLLMGLALIGTPEAFDVLFAYQDDFRIDRRTGFPLALDVIVLLHEMVEDYPAPDPEWIMISPHDPANDLNASFDITPYSQWVESHRHTYRKKEKKPYEIFALLAAIN